VRFSDLLKADKESFLREVTRNHVLRTMRVIRDRSVLLDELIRAGSIKLVGSVYDVQTGIVEFLDEPLETDGK
jgi:carbonic anhydrase